MVKFKRNYIAADGRDLSAAEWRVLPEFPKYEITKDGDVRNRESYVLLQEIENKKTGLWFYCLWQDGRKSALCRNFLGLIESTWPDPDWKDIPDFPKHQVNRQGQVRGKRFWQILPVSPRGYVRLKLDGEWYWWSIEEIGNEQAWNSFWGIEEDVAA